MVEKLQLCEILNGANHLRGVGVLVVVPGNNLYLIGVVIQLGNHGLGSVKQRAIAHADYVVEMGPGGGPDGGNVVYVGTPAKLARTDTPTGRALAAHGRP